MYKVLFILVCIIVQDVYASYCYPDFCQNTTNFIPESQEQCLLQPVKRGEDCKEMRFENLGHVPPSGKALAQVSLTAYVKDLEDINEKATAFNFSITNINFDRLITRYQNLGDEETSSCHRVKFYGNVTTYPLKEFHLSCPFSNNSFENNPYRLEYLISGDNYEYSRKLVFIVPNHRFIDQTVKDVAFYTPFIYIDVSDASILTLYIQPLPQRFNVSKYRVWMMNNDTNSTKEVTLENYNINQTIHHNFSVDNGVLYFKVAALHPICHKYGCINSTSPFISIKQPSHRLLIMIISFIWIPPVILYVIYHTYKLYKKKEILKRAERKPKCLLVYSPSHMAHVNVMIDLARYLRYCNINAMIDTLDIAESTNKDPVLWCNESFHSADAIIIATSPQTDEIAPVIYRNIDNQALRLLKENYPRRNKRYYALQFPYCKANDIPKEARQFKRFTMPEELDKLVKTVHEVEYIRFFGVSDKDFVDSIKLAKLQIVKTERNFQAVEENDLLLPDLQLKTRNSEILQLKEVDMKNTDSSMNSTVLKNFNTNIEELNLLGDATDGNVQTFCFNSTNRDSEFRIDTFNL
ncbi:PREDICTED: uncharacterized protein LOC105364382 isoform X2 [Ceratosolen solmsi marchali]|uniref:Uncharacterized protein LOC105364382 isoform X2 n=1 Tax=Ceratosolen solmsi marchali TaxID=326594 RepID=A0AAJ7DY22_9HYME|nr:PREDICTED: uncharacterized protein LOC105364382 isoform X2 [Ceratosolen solmsi marchali]